MVVGLTRKSATPLLRTVHGKPHASDENHEESERTAAPKVHASFTNEELDRILYAEPESSGDERQSPAKAAQAQKPITPAPRTRIDASLGSKLSKPRQSDRKRPAIRRPTIGSYQDGKADKTKRGLTEDKENDSASTIPMSSADATNQIFGMGYSQGPSKRARGYDSKSRTTNIHAQPRKKVGYGSSKGGSRVTGRIYNSWNIQPQPEVDKDNDSDVSMEGLKLFNGSELENLFGVDEEDGGRSALRTKGAKTKSCKDNGNTKSTAFNNDELSDIMGSSGEPSDDPELRPVKVKTKTTNEFARETLSTLDPDELDNLLKSPPLLDRLGDYMQAQAPLSSQPPPSAPQEELDNIQDYIKQLPSKATEGSACPLCKAPVDPEYYWAFWQGKDKTVKNHTSFCNAHRRKSAQEEYERRGYPVINWDALPNRIRKHKTELHQILTNQRRSGHREFYKPLALTGKAAAVPAQRKDLSEEMQKELDSYAIDDNGSYPGYYGPRGRRTITENIMRVLKNEIKSSKDAVVQGSGPAAFVQAVLVPECAIRLIMEDCKVDKFEAEKIREKTYDMGLMLNEEIEDNMFDVQDDSDVENEYRHE